MSRTLNRVSLIGHLGQSPELRATASGKRVAKMSLATNDGTKDNPRTNWHRLTMWDRLADIAEQWLEKGSHVYVEGRIEYSTSGEGEKTRYWSEIVVQELIMLGSAGESSSGPSGSVPDPGPNDGLPF